MAIRALIFDFGGVLIYDADDHKRRAWESRLGLEAHHLDELVFHSEVSVRATVGKVPVTAIWDHVGKILNLSPKDLQQLQADFWWGDRVRQELLDFIGQMQAEYRIAILSNAWSNARQVFIERFHFDIVSELMIISAEVGLAKPDPRIYTLTLEQLAVAPEEAIFVDDVLENVLAARALGIHAIQFETTAQVITTIKALL